MREESLHTFIQTANYNFSDVSCKTQVFLPMSVKCRHKRVNSPHGGQLETNTNKTKGCLSLF